METFLAMPTRNNLPWLTESIKTLLWYTDLKISHLKVFNNASTDGTGQYLSEHKIDTFNSMVNLSAEEATNFLLDIFLNQTSAKYFCFIHDDMIFTKNWLKIMITEIEKHPSCFCLGCKIITHKNAIIIPDDRRYRISESLKQDFTGRAGAPIFLLTRACIQRIGFFDNNFSDGEFSDYDYYKRIEDLGFKFLLTHKAVIFHAERMLRKQNKDFNRYYKITKDYFLKKHNGEDPQKWGDKIIKYETADNELFQTWGAL